MTEKLRGWGRMRQINTERAARRAQIFDGLIAGIGHIPTELEKVNARNIAFWDEEANYRELLGKNSTEARTKLNQALRAFGARPGGTTKPAPSWDADRMAEYLAATTES